MSTGLVSLHATETPWTYPEYPIVVGKDILEVLSSAMYVDPMAIYREYIQNSADAIDEGRRIGLLDSDNPGVVEIEIDCDKRTAKIHDNGTGIPKAEFDTRMASFGASAKRGTNARGFRGVGRLAGLAYCQELVFRSRAVGEPFVSEFRWDCRKAKTLLRSTDFAGDLAAVVAQSVRVRRIGGRDWPKHFFGVELRGVPRLRNDCLLNPTALEGYLSQVAPVPFAPQFRFAGDIAAMLQQHVGLTNIRLKVAGSSALTFRPHRDSFEVGGGVDTFHEIQSIRIPGSDGGTAAIGWILHHGYKGAVPNANLKGLRLRSGNIQVGDSAILEHLFTEARFNSWCVGEVHVIDSRIVPNGRRDHYEQNVHYTNLINQLSPIAREISTRCRQSSIRRNWLRHFQRQKAEVRRDLEIMKQGSLSAIERQLFASEIRQLIDSTARTLSREVLKMDLPTLAPILLRLRRELARVGAGNYRAKGLDKMAPAKRRAYEEVFALLYECSADRAEAKLLVDRMLARLARRNVKREGR
jgi:Histidine kinase-, DNA gyrase B-, and HSP90-like ATPase